MVNTKPPKQVKSRQIVVRLKEDEYQLLVERFKNPSDGVRKLIEKERPNNAVSGGGGADVH